VSVAGSGLYAIPAASRSHCARYAIRSGSPVAHPAHPRAEGAFPFPIARNVRGRAPHRRGAGLQVHGRRTRPVGQPQGPAPFLQLCP
jgi:hypothetical protein